MAVGAVAMVGAATVDYRRYRELAPLAYGGADAHAAARACPASARKSKGAQAWFQLGSFQLQPSELVKIIVIVTIAAVVANFDSELDLGPARRWCWGCSASRWR